MITRRHFFRSIGGLSALGVSTAAYGVGVEPMLRLRVTRYHPTPRQWPADFPLKIAVIADIHACDPWMSLERIEAIVDRTNALNADIIVLLGDYVAGLHQVTRIIPANEWAKVLAGLKAPLGVHAVMGNHDYWADRTVQQAGHGPTVAHRALEAAGIPVYENDVIRLTKDGRAFWLAGLGDQLAFLPARRFRSTGRFGADDLDATLAKVSDDAPIILLAHEPNRAARARPRRVAAVRPHPWRSGPPARLVAGSSAAARPPARLRACPAEMRRHHLRRPRLQHHAAPRRRAAGDRRGDAGSGAFDRLAALAQPAVFAQNGLVTESEEARDVTAHLDGEIRDGRHHMQVRVYYEDTDFPDLPLS